MTPIVLAFFIGCLVGYLLRLRFTPLSTPTQIFRNEVDPFKFCPRCRCSWETHLKRFYEGVYRCAKCGCPEVPPVVEDTPRA